MGCPPCHIRTVSIEFPKVDAASTTSWPMWERETSWCKACKAMVGSLSESPVRRERLLQSTERASRGGLGRLLQDHANVVYDASRASLSTRSGWLAAFLPVFSTFLLRLVEWSVCCFGGMVLLNRFRLNIWIWLGLPSLFRLWDKFQQKEKNLSG